jgi:hypothetical protein
MPIVIIRIDPRERNEEWEGDDDEGDDRVSQGDDVGWESDDDPLGNRGDLECTLNFSTSATQSWGQLPCSLTPSWDIAGQWQHTSATIAPGGRASI